MGVDSKFQNSRKVEWEKKGEARKNKHARIMDNLTSLIRVSWYWKLNSLFSNSFVFWLKCVTNNKTYLNTNISSYSISNLNTHLHILSCFESCLNSHNIRHNYMACKLPILPLASHCPPTPGFWRQSSYDVMFVLPSIIKKSF